MYFIFLILETNMNRLKMKSYVLIKNICELFPNTVHANVTRGMVNCVELDDKEVRLQFPIPVFLNAAVAIFVLSGTASVWVNYKHNFIQSQTLILLSASHLFHFSECSPDFTCRILLVSKEFMNEMDSTDMIYKRIKYGVRLYNAPVVQLEEEQLSLLLRRVAAIDEMIDNTGHLYQKEMILNHLFTFYLDLSNVLDRRKEFRQDANLTRYESMIKTFIELLITHYRTEHKVEFYASRLNVSAHYLTLIVKRITGQSVCDFIFEMLYSEARNLLAHSKLSIQEITALLNFSDQSSFGKFFRRKSGLSPVDYRKAQK